MGALGIASLVIPGYMDRALKLHEAQIKEVHRVTHFECAWANCAPCKSHRFGALVLASPHVAWLSHRPARLLQDVCIGVPAVLDGITVPNRSAFRSMNCLANGGGTHALALGS